MNFRKQRKEVHQNASSKIDAENFSIRQRNQEIRMKLQRSQKAVEDFMRERNHEIMLKQEQRKLREGDMLKVAQRRKRLELKRKIDIIEKEKRDIEVREEIKRREKVLIETRYENTVRCNMERMNFTNDVLLWSHSGYSTDKATRKRLQLN